MAPRRTRGHPGARAGRIARLGVLAAAGSLFAVFVLLPLAARVFVRTIVLFMDACVWLATSIDSGMSAWSLLAVIATAAARTIVTPWASVVLAALVLVGIGAFYWLERLLGSEEESSQ